MKTCFVALIFLNSHFQESFIRDAIRKTEATFPVPHPFKREVYTKVALSATISVVFYEVEQVNGQKSNCDVAIEFFREDNFLSILQKSASEKRSSFAFYACMYDTDDNFLITSKYTQQGFDERQSIRGDVTRIFTQADGSVTMEDHDAQDHAAMRFRLVDNYLNEEIGVTLNDLTAAWQKRQTAGTVLWEWKPENGDLEKETLDSFWFESDQTLDTIESQLIGAFSVRNPQYVENNLIQSVLLWGEDRSSWSVYRMQPLIITEFQKKDPLFKDPVKIRLQTQHTISKNKINEIGVKMAQLFHVEIHYGKLTYQNGSDIRNHFNYRAVKSWKP